MVDQLCGRKMSDLNLVPGADFMKLTTEVKFALNYHATYMVETQSTSS